MADVTNELIFDVLKKMEGLLPICAVTFGILLTKCARPMKMTLNA